MAAIVRQAGYGLVEKLGWNFGVVVAIVDGKATEIATFRGERYGADAHRPEVVWYCATLKEDLSRRDFTVNAMALEMCIRDREGDVRIKNINGYQFDVEPMPFMLAVNNEDKPGMIGQLGTLSVSYTHLAKNRWGTWESILRP